MTLAVIPTKIFHPTQFNPKIESSFKMKKLLLGITMLLFAACSAVNAADDFSALIFNKQITTGMSFGNVEAAWGKPRKVDRSVYGRVTIEYWFYGENAMVVFENGRVRSFHE